MRDSQTRRRYICTIGAVGTAGLAGCGSGDEKSPSDDGGSETDNTDTESEEDQSTDEEESGGTDAAEEPEASTTDVPMLGYDPARTSAPPGADGPTEAVIRRWHTELDGQLVSSPVVVNETVYTGGSDQEVRAITVDEGNESWSIGTDGPVRSTPAVVNGTVYAGSDGGNLHAVDATDGTEEWIFEIGAQIRSSPAVLNGTVYVGSDDGSYEIDSMTRSELY